jgi:hypothetical protein
LRIFNVDHDRPSLPAWSHHFLTATAGFGRKSDGHVPGNRAGTREHPELRRCTRNVTQYCNIPSNFDIRNSIHQDGNNASFPASRQSSHFGAPLDTLRAESGRSRDSNQAILVHFSPLGAKVSNSTSTQARFILLEMPTLSTGTSYREGEYSR